MARSYVDFAMERANLAEVVFRHEPGRDEEATGQSAAAAFEPILSLFRGAGPAGSASSEGTSAATLVLAILQGIAALTNCGVVPPEAVPELIRDAVTGFVEPDGPTAPEARA